MTIYIALLLLVGCPPTPLCVDVVHTGPELLTMRLGAGGRCDKTPRIRRIEVFRMPGNELLWDASAWQPESSEGLPLTNVTYGVVPEGFSAAVAAAPLAAGESLRIRVAGQVATGSCQVVVGGKPSLSSPPVRRGVSTRSWWWFW